jgi:RNA polymerase sigma factor (sigma-70 family)
MRATRDRLTTETRWVFQDCDESRKERARRAWAEAWPRLERLLATVPPEQHRLLVAVRHDDRPPRDEARVVLILPTGTLVAEESAEDVTPVLNRVAHTLAEEIKRHKEWLRREHLRRRKSRRREVLGAAGPLLRRDAERGRSAAFFDLLRPLLGALHDHARRELRIAELEGTLPRGEVIEDDLIDEVLVRAWRRLKDLPRGVPLDLWLVGLLHQILKEWAEGVPAARGEGPRRAGGEEEWFAPLFGEEETLEWEYLLPAHEDDPALRLEADEERERMLALLSRLPTMQRQAFALRALEGYEADEIAQVQGRPESEVLAEIEAARRTLLYLLREAGQSAKAESGIGSLGSGAATGLRPPRTHQRA